MLWITLAGHIGRRPVTIPATFSGGSHEVSADTIPARLLRNAEQIPATAAYFEKVDGAYESTSWSEYADQVR